jgi:anti-sigma factor RsiW
MNCADIRLLLHAHADGELDAANSLDLERHLKTCAACAAENKSLQSLRAAFRAGDLNFQAPASLKNDVRQFVRDLDAKPASRRDMVPWLWKWLALGATAFALLTIFLRPSGLSEHDAFLNEVIASHVRSLQAEHLTDVPSSDQHTVKPWFDGKLDFAPDVKDFTDQNFPLLGGRLDYLDGRAVAGLVYRHNKHLINVFVWPATGAMKSKTESRRGYSIINGAAHGLHYCIISDLNATELNELALLLEKQPLSGKINLAPALVGNGAYLVKKALRAGNIGQFAFCKTAKRHDLVTESSFQSGFGKWVARAIRPPRSATRRPEWGWCDIAKRPLLLLWRVVSLPSGPEKSANGTGGSPVLPRSEFKSGSPRKRSSRT